MLPLRYHSILQRAVFDVVLDPPKVFSRLGATWMFHQHHPSCPRLLASDSQERVRVRTCMAQSCWCLTFRKGLSTAFSGHIDRPQVGGWLKASGVHILMQDGGQRKMSITWAEAATRIFFFCLRLTSPRQEIYSFPLLLHAIRRCGRPPR